MSFQSKRSFVELVSTLQAMKKQEDDVYWCENNAYVPKGHMGFLSSPETAPVDGFCRSRMIEWCFQVVDFCKFSRETVAIAANYLDRYTHCSAEAINNRRSFQLASMTCLYTAIKIHEPQAMEPQTVSNMSRGVFSADEITDMERKILAALKWRVNPPTAISFVHHYLDTVPENVLSSSERSAVFELSKLQTEFAVKDSGFVTSKPSTIALAALNNALTFALPSSLLSDSIMGVVIQFADLHCNAFDLLDVKCRLFRGLETSVFTVSPGGTCSRTDVVCKQQANSELLGSPRSVSVTTSQAYMNDPQLP